MSEKSLDFPLAAAVSSSQERDVGEHLGVGVFETFLAHCTVATTEGATTEGATREGATTQIAITCFDRHWKRLAAGCARIGCSVPEPEECLAAIHASCDLKVGPDVQVLQRVRIVVRPSGWKVTSEPFIAIDTSIPQRVISVHAERSLPELKSCSSLISVLARREAAERGAIEAILVDRLGIAREGAWSNFFWLSRDGIWRTPEHSILLGVTRSILWEMLAAENRLRFCDVPWSTICEDATDFILTQATNGVLPISSLDQRAIATTESTKLCARAEAEFARLRIRL